VTKEMVRIAAELSDMHPTDLGHVFSEVSNVLTDAQREAIVQNLDIDYSEILAEAKGDVYQDGKMDGFDEGYTHGYGIGLSKGLRDNLESYTNKVMEKIKEVSENEKRLNRDSSDSR
jgi:flagellar biosynthesis/type III secretory pathway protein FliH